MNTNIDELIQDITLKYPLTCDNIKNSKRQYIPLSGEFQEVFSNPQDKGIWFIWGTSGSGKSSFTMQLVSELVKHYKVLYNSKEENPRDDSFFQRMERFGITYHNRNFHAVEDNYLELIKRLKQRGSPKVIVIDSAEYFFKGGVLKNGFSEYLELKERFPNKIFIITGHGTGNRPRSELETSIMFDADMKISVDAFGATNKGRKFGKKNLFIIWKERYEELHGTNEK